MSEFAELLTHFARRFSRINCLPMLLSSRSETDFEALVRLAAACRDHLRQSMPSEVDFRKSIAMLLRDPGTEFFLACGTRGTALGYVQCRYRYAAWTSALEAELEDVFVVREARRRGVGRRLIEFAMARAADKWCRSIGLGTNERNEGAHTLYEPIPLIMMSVL